MKRLLLVLLTAAACGDPAPAPSAGTTRISDPVLRIFQELDSDGSGGLQQGELMAWDPASLMPMLDGNGDGQVDLEELRADLNAWPEPKSARPESGEPPQGDLPPPALRPGEQERPEDAQDGPPRPGRRP